ncbi:Hypothetical Protein PANA_0275 [Pantoea ananatis LMG 20103]|uniref:Isochorismatase-like domain-containing protein n=1 Tax=Pantoea ananatis (strain LMG 20103) TaxID=706191 RepID=D4GHC7_PANAM|nr:Hypothetical Protein PANA_0275 [Pantoea ananatis LMG 20103]
MLKLRAIFFTGKYGWNALHLTSPYSCNKVFCTAPKLQIVILCRLGNTASQAHSPGAIMQRVVMVVDMQNGVFESPRFDRAGRVAQINRLIRQADITLFIQHREGNMIEGSHAFALLPEIEQPQNAYYVTKTACDSFWQTTLASLLSTLAITDFVICGCATDYCVDTTLKVGAGLGYRITVAADAHTTADRTYANAEQLIGQHNEVWAALSMPGNVPRVVDTATLLAEWR